MCITYFGQLYKKLQLPETKRNNNNNNNNNNDNNNNNNRNNIKNSNSGRCTGVLVTLIGRLGSTDPYSFLKKHVISIEQVSC